MRPGAYIGIDYPSLKSMTTTAIDVRVTGEARDSAERLADLSGMSVSTITEQALRDYAEWRIPQLQDLLVCIEAADRGEFATEDEANAFFAAHGA